MVCPQCVKICQIGIGLWGSLYEWHRAFARTVLEHPDVPMHLKSDDVMIIHRENSLKSDTPRSVSSIYLHAPLLFPLRLFIYLLAQDVLATSGAPRQHINRS